MGTFKNKGLLRNHYMIFISHSLHENNFLESKRFTFTIAGCHFEHTVIIYACDDCFEMNTVGAESAQPSETVKALQIIGIDFVCVFGDHRVTRCDVCVQGLKAFFQRVGFSGELSQGNLVRRTGSVSIHEVIIHAPPDHWFSQFLHPEKFLFDDWF